MPETHADITPTCPACGSDAIVPDVRVSYGGAYTTHVALDQAPDAPLRKQTVTVEASHRVCSDCGFVMLVAGDPRALWDAHVERLSRQLDS